MEKRYDVIVIGAGPAGYVAAIRCAQLGFKTACVDDWRTRDGKPALGGTCLNVGCIPSKALLESSDLYAQARDSYADRGVAIKGLALDLGAMLAHKERVVAELTSGITTLFKANGIDWITGRGVLQPKRQVQVTDARGHSRTYAAEHVVIAAGSVPVEIDAAPLTDGLIVDSSGALQFDDVPRRLGVIGAGVIGLELGSVWRRLGSEVVLLEAQERFLPMVDEQVAGDAAEQFAAQGLDIRLGARVRSCTTKERKVTVEVQDKDGERRERFDRLIVAVGRRPNTRGLYAAEAELLLDEWGVIHVDEQCRTNLPGVYAIGDAVRGPMLAHKGAEEGIMVAELIAGREARVNYDAIPSVIYTAPEIAWVGKTEHALKSAGEPCRTGIFSFAANGRARAMGIRQGFVKIVTNAETDRVRGVHMIGPHCSELIALGVSALEYGATAEDIALTVYAHPSLAESFHEAALAAGGRAIHAFTRRSASQDHP